MQSACSPKQDENLRQDILRQETELARYKRMAENVCVCTEDLIGVLKKLELMSDEEKEQLSKDISLEIDAESIKAEKCMDDIEKKEDEIGNLKEDMTEAALKQYCPDFYNMLKIGRIN